MSTAPEPNHQPLAGEEVTLLVHTEDRPLWTTGKITSYAPFCVEIDGSGAELLRSVTNVLVLHDSGRKYSKGEGHVGEFIESEGKAWLKFSDFRWEVVDNRDNPRFEVEINAMVRFVQEFEGKVVTEDQVGVVKNLSLGGALVQLNSSIAKGQLVEFRVTLENSIAVRAMGVVAHTSPSHSMVGISFVDYIGSARYSLHQFLQKLAA